LDKNDIRLATNLKYFKDKEPTYKNNSQSQMLTEANWIINEWIKMGLIQPSTSINSSLFMAFIIKLKNFSQTSKIVRKVSLRTSIGQFKLLIPISRRIAQNMIKAIARPEVNKVECSKQTIRWTQAYFPL
jgi:hypothetical protein